MLRAIGKVLVWTAPLVLAGCDDGGYYDNRGYSGYGFCRQFSSCDECTPMYGCGWCTYGKGQGICLSDPYDCRTPQFTWTWEPKACAALGDAGTSTPRDGGADGSNDGSSAACRWPPSADTLSGSDAGATGCLPSTGGNICASSQYTLTCYGMPPSTPDAALGCSVATVPAPMNVLFHCCPCAP